MKSLKDLVVVITGASSGIGEAAAAALAKRGAKVVLAARRTERLENVVKTIEQDGGTASFCKTDVTSRSDVDNLAQFAVDKYGRIDVWINNAGIMPLSFLDKRKVDEWERMVDVNIKGVLYGIAAAIPIMEEQKSGHIINVSSVAGHVVGLGSAVYSGTKFAVRAITEGLRLELSRKSGIRTTIISPGSVETELRNTITDPDALRMLDKRQIEKRMEAEDIANAIVYAIEQPDHVSVNEILIRPTTQR